MEQEAIYILTLLQLKNHEKLRGKYIKLSYEELLNFTIKTLKIMEAAKYGRINY